jgi:rhamnulokinase
MKLTEPAHKQRFIGFDLGAESGRCVVATLEDRRIRLEHIHRFTTHTIRNDQGFHWDIMAIVREIVESLTKTRMALGARFQGIGIDTWGVDYVLIDADGHVLNDPYHYRDVRTDNIMAKAFSIVPREDLYKAVGIQFMQFNTVFQLLAESESRENPLSVASAVLMMSDYLNYVLSGNKKSDFSIASTTGLADPRTRDWCWQMIDAFGFRRRIFPPMVEPGTRLGTLLPSLAATTGIDSSTPVFAITGHDTASAVASVPATGGTWAFLSSGTWSLMGIELNKPLLTSDAMRYNFTNEGGIGGTTRFLKNITGLWPIQECRRYWKEHGREYTYAELADLAKQEGFVEAWVDLSDPRFLKPEDMPSKITSYLRETGQAAKDGAGFIIRVVVESLAFSYRKTIKELEEVVGAKIETLHAVGGGIQNGLLVQCTADALGIPVLAGPVEGTIVGNIGVQAIAAGAVSNLHAWREIVSRSFELKRYTPEHTDYFNSHEAQFTRCLRNASGTPR